MRYIRIIEDVDTEPKVVETEEPGDILAEAKETPVEETTPEERPKKKKRADKEG